MSRNMDNDLGKRLLAEFLGFLKYKVEHDGLTLEEEQAMLRVIEDSVPLSATADDLSGYYDKSPVAVRSVLHRKMLSKPKRRVMYDFKEIRRIVPDKWKK